MKSNIRIEYVEKDGIYTGWAKDYTAVVAQGENIEEIERKILKMLEVMFRYFADKVEKGEMETEVIKVELCQQ